MSDFMSYIDTAADAVSSAASDASWLDTGIKYANNAFEWMETYPEATKLLAGVAGGVGSYLTAQSQLKQKQEFAKEQWDREREARRIQPGQVNNYGSHVASAKGGLLTNGMIVGNRR